ncbi:MAG: hypothetical protein Tsb005_06120 [Gammaproteobacteria bacterium]
MDTPFDRDAEYKKMQAIMESQDKKRQFKAQIKFASKENLEQGIINLIYPNIVILKTERGIVGMSFFQFDQWLVTNTHLVPSVDILQGTELIDYQGNSLQQHITQSFHRSNDNQAPDIVVIKLENYKASKPLPTLFSNSECYAERYWFYIAYDFATKQYQIKYLQLASDTNSLPLKYMCQDGSIPQPGHSGAPIIEARLTLGREPVWEFKVVAILYARATHFAPHNTKVVCAIPTLPDFRRLLSIHLAKNFSDRYSQMAFASEALNDQQGKEDAANYIQQSQLEQQHAKTLFIKYQQGESALNIALPDDLEHLLGKTIIGLEQSCLIEKNLKKLAGKHDFSHVKTVTPEELYADYESLLKSITNDVIQLSKIDSFFSTPCFRIDVAPGGNKNQKYWMLQLQDNTGKNIKIQGQPLSSVFAIVKIKNSESIEGTKLVELIKASVSQQNEVEYTPELTASNKKETKKSNFKNKSLSFYTKNDDKKNKKKLTEQKTPANSEEDEDPYFAAHQRYK